MKRQEIRTRIEQVGVIPALRMYSEADALFAAEAVHRGGITIAEVSMTIPDAAKVISRLAHEHPRMTIGAGSVLDASAAQIAIDAGAQFLTSDGLHFDVVGFAAKHDLVVFPGALTPTEVIAAWKSGCDFVKVVPCVQIGGVSYINSLSKMFPYIPLIAAGGVNQQDATDFILAGAVALGVGRELIPSDAVRLRQAERIAELAHRFLGFVKTGREQLAERKLRPAHH